MTKTRERKSRPALNRKSPAQEWLNGKITHVDQSEIQVEYEVRDDMSEAFNVIQRGLLSLVQTEVAELMYSLVTGVKHQFVTNISSHFIRKNLAGSRFTVSAKSIPRHFQQEIETMIRDESGQITAIGRISFQSD